VRNLGKDFDAVQLQRQNVEKQRFPFLPMSCARAAQKARLADLSAPQDSAEGGSGADQDGADDGADDVSAPQGRLPSILRRDKRRELSIEMWNQEYKWETWHANAAELTMLRATLQASHRAVAMLEQDVRQCRTSLATAKSRAQASAGEITAAQEEVLNLTEALDAAVSARDDAVQATEETQQACFE
jgi:chromosome segregation ATPase